MKSVPKTSLKMQAICQYSIWCSSNYMCYHSQCFVALNKHKELEQLGFKQCQIETGYILEKKFWHRFDILLIRNKFVMNLSIISKLFLNFLGNVKSPAKPSKGSNLHNFDSWMAPRELQIFCELIVGWPLRLSSFVVFFSNLSSFAVVN